MDIEIQRYVCASSAYFFFLVAAALCVAAPAVVDVVSTCEVANYVGHCDVTCQAFWPRDDAWTLTIIINNIIVSSSIIIILPMLLKVPRTNNLILTRWNGRQSRSLKRSIVTESRCERNIPARSSPEKYMTKITDVA